jgi:ABC-type glucose/galactose transport system permease subunit
MKTLGQITLIFILLVSALLTALLGVHVVLSIATLFSLPFITTLSFSQIYGFWLVFSLLSYKYKKEETDKETSDTPFQQAFMNLATTAVTYLLIWGIATIIFNILN